MKTIKVKIKVVDYNIKYKKYQGEYLCHLYKIGESYPSLGATFKMLVSKKQMRDWIEHKLEE